MPNVGVLDPPPSALRRRHGAERRAHRPAGDDVGHVTTSLDATPVFLGCSDVDSHIPAERVLESEAVFRRLGAAVTRKLYPGMGHTVIGDEIEQVQRVMDAVLQS